MAFGEERTPMNSEQKWADWQWRLNAARRDEWLTTQPASPTFRRGIEQARPKPAQAEA